MLCCAVCQEALEKGSFMFGCAGSSMLWGLFSSCREWGLLSGGGGELLTAAASPVEEHRPRSARPSAAGAPGR